MEKDSLMGATAQERRECLAVRVAHRIEFGHGSVDVAKALLLDEAHPERRVRCVKVGVEVDDRRQVGRCLQLAVLLGWRL